MRIKPGVILSGIQTPMLRVLVVVNAAYSRQGIEVWITSALDGPHMKGSLHFKGLALDFRTQKIPAYAMNKIVKEIDSELGDDFDVVLEETHLHVEYDRKGKRT
jgi:hypothetical protein